ncbi:MAG: transposase [Cyanobacteria bacterium]|nr:transposase [Cyanobacteria bacterium bin.51]
MESFNRRFRDEFLTIELFASILEARSFSERWRMDCNTDRPHSSLQGRTPLEAVHWWSPSQTPTRSLSPVRLPPSHRRGTQAR